MVDRQVGLFGVCTCSISVEFVLALGRLLYRVITERCGGLRSPRVLLALVDFSIVTLINSLWQYALRTFVSIRCGHLGLRTILG